MWKRALAALLCGLVFGLGLTISEMINPQKVLAFLDIGGDWDPSLALVMASALIVTFSGYRLVLSRGQPLFDTRFHLPELKHIDPRLLVGSALFGIGWGLAGFCPGPALTAATLAYPQVMVFLAAMLVGMFVHHIVR